MKVVQTKIETSQWIKRGITHTKISSIIKF